MTRWRALRLRLYEALRPAIKHWEASLIARMTAYVPNDRFHDGDTFIISYPRSGNLWLRNLIVGVKYGMDLDSVRPSLLESIIPGLDDRYYYKRIDTPMFFWGHVLPRPEFKRVIYLVRDGRDALVSLWHAQTARDGPIDFLTLVQNEDRYGHGWQYKWHEHVETWLANPYQADMLVMKYEDLQRDPVAELKRFCTFAGLERDEAILARVVEQGSFRRMREREVRQDGWGVQFGAHKGQYYVRRGQSGSYRDEMPADVQAAFVAQAGDTLRKCGYPVED